MFNNQYESKGKKTTGFDEKYRLSSGTHSMLGVIHPEGENKIKSKMKKNEIEIKKKEMS